MNILTLNTYSFVIVIAISNVYTSDGKRVFFFSDDPSNHVWYVMCRQGYEETRRCPKKYIFIRLYATSIYDIRWVNNGIEQLGLTDNMGDLLQYIDLSKSSKLNPFFAPYYVMNNAFVELTK